MADKSPIEWTDATWNPIVGCSIVSPGCTNCYAMKMAGRIEAMGGAPHYAGTTKKVNGKARGGERQPDAHLSGRRVRRASGYEQFRELVDWTQDLAGLTEPQRVWALCFERVSVGMIEALNTAEDRFERLPAENTMELWNAIGAALATINAQAFTSAGKVVVRREMLAAIKAGYDRALKGITEGMPE